ncbi:MAG TPA: 50S ribosomal protein L25 [Candidatus Paceibacterota bacterium]
MLTLEVTKREGKGNGSALRRKGFLPAVMYGRDDAATSVTLDARTFGKIFKTAGESTIISIKGLGEEKQALIHDVAFDPVTGDPLHADFYLIAKGQLVTVEVPLEFIGVSPAVKDLGGILVKVIHALEIEVDPKELPHSLPVDISKLATLEDQILVKDLPLPPSAKPSIPLDEVVAMIAIAKEEVEEVAAPIDLTQIEVEKRGKKEEEGEAPAAE